jgi:hypothetical protein
MHMAASLLVELGLTHLTRDTRARLAHELIDSLADGADQPGETPPKLKHELYQRLDQCNHSPDGLVNWTDLKRQLHGDVND